MASVGWKGLTELACPMIAPYVCVRKGSGSTLGHHTDHSITPLMICLCKAKGHPMTFLCRHRSEAEVKLVPTSHLVLERHMWLVPRSGHFSLGYEPILCKRQGVGVPRTILDVPQNFAPAGILSPDLPARCGSL
jgi:hypothetical protein